MMMTTMIIVCDSLSDKLSLNNHNADCRKKVCMSTILLSH